MTSFQLKSPLNNKNIIATIASDGQVYSLDNNTSNFVKMLTFPSPSDGTGNESMLKNTTPAIMLDMGKSLIQYAKDDNVEGVAEMMGKGKALTFENFQFPLVDFRCTFLLGLAGNDSDPLRSC